MKKLYVAGPLSADTPAEYINNVSNMLGYAVDFWDNGVAVFCPCLDIQLGICSLKRHEYDDYFNASLEWLKVSDAMFVIDESPGVLREMDVAKECGIPIFKKFSDVMDWANDEPIGD